MICFQNIPGSAGALIAEEKILLSITANSTSELNLQALRSMIRKTDSELVATLVRAFDRWLLIEVHFLSAGHLDQRQQHSVESDVELCRSCRRTRSFVGCNHDRLLG